MKTSSPTDLKTLMQPKDSKKATDEMVRQYLLPLVFFIAALIMVFGLVLPQLDYTTSLINQIGELQTKYNDLIVKRNNLTALMQNTNTQKNTLEVVNKIAPQSQTAVVNFAEKIRTKASESNLTLSNTVTGEVVTVATGDVGKTTGSLELVELPAEFSLQGNFNDIRSFLGSLYAGDDFIIIKKMDLRKKAGANPNDAQFTRGFVENWTLNIILAKYQLRASGNATDAELQKSFFAVSESSKPQLDVINFIMKNYGQSGSNNNGSNVDPTSNN